MIKNGKGGGNTKTGLVFEGKTDLATFLNSQEGYRVTDGVVFYNDEKVARIFKKHGFYRYLKEVGVDWTKIISKKLLPDDSIYVIINNTLFIIECKYQQVAGSVDEKLQTCDFKRKQYQKLMAQLNIDVEYIYLLSDWFKDPKYKDVLIISLVCVAGGIEKRGARNGVLVSGGIGENVVDFQLHRFRFRVVGIEKQNVVVETKRALIIAVKVKRLRFGEERGSLAFVTLERSVQRVRVVGVRRFAPFVKIGFEIEIEAVFISEEVAHLIEIGFGFFRGTVGDGVLEIRAGNLRSEKRHAFLLGNGGGKHGKHVARFFDVGDSLGEAMPRKIGARAFEIAFRRENVVAVAVARGVNHVRGDFGAVPAGFAFDGALADKGDLIAERHGSDVVRERGFRFVEKRKGFRRATGGDVAVRLKQDGIDFLEDFRVAFHDALQSRIFRCGGRGNAGTGVVVERSRSLLGESGGSGKAGRDRSRDED